LLDAVGWINQIALAFQANRTMNRVGNFLDLLRRIRFDFSDRRLKSDVRAG
jgi:hypothetical protein